MGLAWFWAESRKKRLCCWSSGLGFRLEMDSTRGGGAEDRWLNVVDFWNPVYGGCGLNDRKGLVLWLKCVL